MIRSVGLALALLSVPGFAFAQTETRGDSEIPADAWDGLESVPATLSHTWEAGQVFSMWSSQDMNINQMGMSVTMNQSMLYEYEVVEVMAEGGVRMTATCTALRFEQAAMGQQVLLDTAEGISSGNPVVDAMGNMCGVSIRMQLNAAGEVEFVSGSEELIEAVMADVPAHMAGMLQGQLEGSLSDEALGRQMQDSFIVFPEESLSPGDSWDVSVAMPLNQIGEVNTNNTYTYLGVTEHMGFRCARLFLHRTCDGAEEREVELQGMPAVVSMDAFEGSTVCYVRLDDGLPIEVEPMSLSYVMDMQVMGQAMAVTTDMEIMSRLDGEE